jgi:hypothetical protein
METSEVKQFHKIVSLQYKYSFILYSQTLITKKADNHAGFLVQEVNGFICRQFSCPYF